MFHRMFYTEGGTKFEQSITYDNIPDLRIHIGLNDLREILNKEGFVSLIDDKWNIMPNYNMGTFIFRRNK